MVSAANSRDVPEPPIVSAATRLFTRSKYSEVQRNPELVLNVPGRSPLIQYLITKLLAVLSDSCSRS